VDPARDLAAGGGAQGGAEDRLEEGELRVGAAGAAAVGGELAVADGGGGGVVGVLVVEGLVEGDAEAVLVAAGVAGAAAELLGGDVEGGADDGGVGGEAEVDGAAALAGFAALGGDGEAEVGDADVAVVADEHVVGFEVAVAQAAAGGAGGVALVGVEDDGVDGLQAAAGLEVDGEQLAPGAAFLPDAEGGALDVLHGEVDAVVVGAGVVDADDVGVIDLGEDRGLSQEALALDGAVLGGGADQLDRGLAVEGLVVGEEYVAHGAAADPADDDVVADPRRALVAGEEASVDAVGDQAAFEVGGAGRLHDGSVRRDVRARGRRGERGCGRVGHGVKCRPGGGSITPSRRRCRSGRRHP
jgi:hypothetical protein